MRRINRILGLLLLLLSSILVIYFSRRNIRQIISNLDVTNSTLITKNEINITNTTNSTANITSKQNPISNLSTWWQSSHVPQTESGTDTSPPCVSVSIILFGVPKEFHRIWKNYMRYIVYQNPHIRKIEAFMHMYSDLHLSGFTNAKNNEINVTTQSPSDIQRVLDNSIGVGNQNYTIPVRLVTSSQREYDETGLAWVEERDLEHFSGFSIDTLKNLFRQGNSIQQAYILENATSDMMKNKTFVFLRSDTLLVSPIDIPCSGLPPEEIHIPSWQTKGFPEYNDRAALAGSAAAYKYARAKSDAFREMILDRRNKKGEEKLEWASAQRMRQLLDPKKNRENKLQYNSEKIREQLHNPEKMLKFYLEYGDGVKLRVIEKDEKWMKLIRVRSGGLLHDGTRWGVKERLLNATNIRR